MKEGKYSIEILYHFQCPNKHWFSIGDAILDEYMFCPKCGEKFHPLKDDNNLFPGPINL